LIVFLGVTAAKTTLASKQSSLEWMSVVLTCLSFATTITTGALLSVDRKMPSFVHRAHQILPFITIFLTIASLFSLFVGMDLSRSLPATAIFPQVSSAPSPSATTTITVTPSPRRYPIGDATSTFTPTPSRIIQTLDPTFVSMEETSAYRNNIIIPSTMEARKAKCKDGYILEMPLDVIIYSTNQWSIFTCSPVPEDPDQLWTPGVVDYGTRYTQVLKTDFSQSWVIQHSSFDYSKINRPDALMIPYRWTKDGSYLYLYASYYPGPSGGGAVVAFYDVDPLYRLNLKTGKFETMLQGVLSFSFSPNDQYLIYIKQEEPNVIHLLDMSGGTEKQIPFDGGLVTGRFSWSLDSTKVVFASGFGKSGEDISLVSVYVLSIKYSRIQPLLIKDSRMLIPDSLGEEWINPETIRMFSLSSNEELWGDYTLNIKTGEITALSTPTPEPTLEKTPPS